MIDIPLREYFPAYFQNAQKFIFHRLTLKADILLNCTLDCFLFQEGYGGTHYYSGVVFMS